jgi:hypothetical protein
MLIESPPAHPRIRCVHSFEELLSTPFAYGVNALCWPRELPGDFAEVVRLLEGRKQDEGIRSLDEATLRSLPLSDAGKQAVDVLVEDLQRLQSQGLDPLLDCIRSYPRDEDAGAVPTDVYSWHADSATTQADTWLCTYHGPWSEGLPNEQAQRRVDVPETRAALMEEYGGSDDEGFREYLGECCYDLHYVPLVGAQPYGFGQGNLWRIATDYPGSPVPPCIHRAPLEISGDLPRLLLIS